MGPIPWRDIVSYAEHGGFDEDMTLIMVQVITEMDAAYLAWQAEEARRNNAATPSSRGDDDQPPARGGHLGQRIGT